MATLGPSDRGGAHWRRFDVSTRSWLPTGVRRPGRDAGDTVMSGVPHPRATGAGGPDGAAQRDAAAQPDGAAQRDGAPEPWRLWPAVGAPTVLVLTALLVFGLAATAVHISHGYGRVAPWWPAAGIGVVAVLATPQRLRWAVPLVVCAATFAGNALLGRPLAVAVGFSLSNMLDVAIVGWWLLRGRGRAALQGVEDVVRLLVGTALGVLAFGVAVGTTAVLTDYGTFLTPALGAMSSHAAAILLVVPLALVPRGHDLRVSLVEVALQSAALAGAVLLTFGPPTTAPVGFLILPPAVWGALRLPPRLVSAQVLGVGVLVTVLTGLGGGPVAGTQDDPALRALLLQAHVFTVAVVTLPLAVAANTRRQVLDGLAASERLFREGFSESLVGMLLLRLCRGDGTTAHAPGGLDVVEANPVAARLLDQTEDRLIGTCWTSSLRDQDRELLAEVVQGMQRRGVAGWHGEVELVGARGRRFLEVALSNLPMSVGAGMFVAQIVDVTARREAEERLTAQALQDPLTGLANRTLLRDRIGLALTLLPLDHDEPGAEPGEEPGQRPDVAAVHGPVAGDGPCTAVLFCDLDDFKHVNDSAGHTVGDAVLVEVARRLDRLLRPGDLAARPGGDEFVVLRPTAGPGHAEALAAEIIEAVAAPVEVDAHTYTVGVSIGIVHGRRGCSVEDLLRDADAAMYAAKAEGKGRAVVYSGEHRERALRNVRLRAELRDALRRRELRVHLQPVVDVRTGVTVAAEALVRWQHPERGLLAPGEWLDVAESGGLMPELGAWVLQEACAAAAAWPVPDGGRPVAVHVNVSARQLEAEGFVDTVRDVLARTGLPPERLVLEFTETHLDEVTEALVEDLVELRQTGIGMAADDYGTGYSPLTRIIELPLTMIKIDRRFVGDMLDDVRSGAVVTTLVRLGQTLGLDVVAEGVETPAQADALAGLGCRHGQGYLWSRPVPAEAFAVLPVVGATPARPPAPVVTAAVPQPS
nr:EAL domain-containing protein [uncultured Actinotalea sp.]